MSEITIVTAFFDIGRSFWTEDLGFPPYLHRTNETYFDRFSHLATLENEMIIFTSKDLAGQVKTLRGSRKTHVVTLDFNTLEREIHEKIKHIQKSISFKSKIAPEQRINPEYWNTDYVLVNYLKSTFVCQAIQQNLVTNPLVAWIDFGYCRSESTLNGVTCWKFPFNPDKIHLFTIKTYQNDVKIIDVIAHNDVFMTGPCIVAGKHLWLALKKLVEASLNTLFEQELVDDDQTLLLMSYLQEPNIFELHPVSPQDWFVAFKKFHKS